MFARDMVAAELPLCVLCNVQVPVLSKCCTKIMMSLLLGASRERISNFRQNRRRTVTYDFASYQNWTIFFLVWKPFHLGTDTSTTSNVKTSSPNMEKEKDVGQIIRKWEIYFFFKSWHKSWKIRTGDAEYIIEGATATSKEYKVWPLRKACRTTLSVKRRTR